MNILFLHTLGSNTDLFAPLAEEKFPQHTISHDVQETFLTDIRTHGQNTQTTQAIHAYLENQLNNGIDYIVCTCSTLGPVADSFPNEQVFRVDKPMAQLSAKYTTCLVAVTLESTIEPTRELLESQAPNTLFEFLFVEGAWDLYASQQLNAFNQFVADCVSQSLQQENTYQAVVLAQASMTDAAPLIVSNLPVLTSPDTCLAYLAERLN
ncbi:hypothetical protein [Vibrio maerlii]|uniref:hypothetical protein n=1 Tax=Vibrio maerlii TaxID=2231648 RepID=UPI000E3D7193|nr:hypothetical protein [Vibrio maerlii]